MSSCKLSCYRAKKNDLIRYTIENAYCENNDHENNETEGHFTSLWIQYEAQCVSRRVCICNVQEQNRKRARKGEDASAAASSLELHIVSLIDVLVLSIDFRMEHCSAPNLCPIGLIIIIMYRGAGNFHHNTI